MYMIRHPTVVEADHQPLRSVARLDATKTSLIKALSSNETASNWGVSTSSPEVIVYRRKILQALQQGDQVRSMTPMGQRAGGAQTVECSGWRDCAAALAAKPARFAGFNVDTVTGRRTHMGRHFVGREPPDQQCVVLRARPVVGGDTGIRDRSIMVENWRRVLQVSERQELWVDLAGERLVDSVLERAAATSSAVTLKRRSSADVARQVRTALR